MRLTLLFVDLQNNITEKEQRWGSKTVEGSGRLDSVE